MLTLDDLDVADVDDATAARAKALAGWITLGQCRGARGPSDNGGDASSSDDDDGDADSHEHDLSEALSLFNSASDLHPSCLEVGRLANLLCLLAVLRRFVQSHP